MDLSSSAAHAMSLGLQGRDAALASDPIQIYAGSPALSSGCQLGCEPAGQSRTFSQLSRRYILLQRF